MAEELNKHFSSIADTIRAKIPESDTDFRTSLKNSPAYSFFADHIHTNEVTKIINSLGPKSTGPCSIPNTILKMVLIDISEILAKIFNLSIQTGIFPSVTVSTPKWGQITMIYQTDCLLLINMYKSL